MDTNNLSNALEQDPPEKTTATLGLVAATKGSVQKKFTLGDDGKLIKDPHHHLAVSAGWFSNIEVSGLEGLRDGIIDLKPNEALTLGVSGKPPVGGLQGLVLTTAEKWAAEGKKEGTIARTKECITWPRGNFFLLLDHDAEPGSPPLSPEDFCAHLIACVPELEGVGRLITHSTSSFIYNSATGECLKGEGNYHTYIECFGDVNRFLKLLKVRLWAGGEGFFKLASPNARTGVSAVLERLLLDMSVFSPERLVYEAGADLGPGLEQRRPAPTLYPGRVLDLDSLPAPTEAEIAAAAANRAAAEGSERLEQFNRATEFQSKEKNLEPEAAEMAAQKAIQDCDRGILSPDHILYFADGTEVTAGEITKDHVKIKLRDPQEPDYDGGRFIAKVLWNKKTGFRIHSFAHGRKIYTIESLSTATVGGAKGEGAAELPPRGFSTTTEYGLIYTEIVFSENGPEADITNVGNHLQAIAYVNTPDGDNAGLLVEFKTYRGVIRRWTLERRSLGGDVSAVIGELLAREYNSKYSARKLLTQYLCELGKGLEESYTVTDSTGWVDGSFVLPSYTVGDESIRFQDVEPLKDSAIEVKGTAQSWAENVGRKCNGNSRLIFGVGAALAAPLQELLDIESGGFHVVGETSKGKTTVLNTASSVVGIKKIPSWNSTANGLEAVATAHNHLLLPLDEIGQADPREVGKAAYLLGNGQGKVRMTRSLTRRKPKQWQLLTLSSGEVTIIEYLRQAGISVKGGMEVRMLDIPVVPKGGQYGAFETIHKSQSAAAFVAELERDCTQNHGAVFKEFLEKLVADRQDSEFVPKLRRRLWEIINGLIGDEKDSAIGRAAKRFALVQVALEIAHGYGLLPFPLEQCAWAVSTLLRDWVDARGGAGSIEVKQACERIEELFVTNQYSDRIYDLDSPRVDQDGKIRPIRDLLAYVRGGYFWVPSAVFSEMAKGVDRSALLEELKKRGWWLGGGADGKTAQTRRGPDGPIRVYVFRKFWAGEESTVQEEQVQAPEPPIAPGNDSVEFWSDSTPISPPPATPLRNTGRWIPTHKTTDGGEVVVERRYGPGLAAVRDRTGKAHQVNFKDLVSLASPVEVSA